MQGKELDGLVERLAKVRLFAGMALSLAVQRLVARGEIVHPGHSRFVIRGIV